MTHTSTANLPAPQRVAILGIGLLGGSFGLACRQYWPATEVIGLSRSEHSRQQALDCGAVTRVTADLPEACAGADWIIVATPVEQIASLAIQAAEQCQNRSSLPLIMDLGSTKGSIVRTVDQHPLARHCFVGAHPIAGSEKTGAANSRSDLFQQRVTVLTPTSNTDQARLQQARAVWQTMQSKIVEMTPEAHDEALACVSHLPHLMASMLAGLLPPSMRSLVGTGWLDTTRVASGDPLLWTSICRENPTAILNQLKSAKLWIEKLAGHIQAEQFNQVHELLEAAKATREAVQSELSKVPPK